MVAYLPAQSTMEVTFTSVEFNADLFAMANNENFKVETSYNPVTTYGIVKGSKIVLTNIADMALDKTQDAGHLPAIAGLEFGDTATAGKFTITPNTENSDDGQDYTITFSAEDVVENQEVEIYYEQKFQMTVAKMDNKKSAFGQVILKYPVYAGGDEDSLQSASDGGGIKGYAIMDIYRARATSMPGFDTSYKSTAENSVTFSTMDPSKAQGKDGKVYDIRYFTLNNSTGVK